MAVERYRSVEDMSRPWRDPDDPGNLRAVASMMAIYRSLIGSAASRSKPLQRFRTLEEANAARYDPYRQPLPNLKPS